MKLGRVDATHWYFQDQQSLISELEAAHRDHLAAGRQVPVVGLRRGIHGYSGTVITAAGAVGLWALAEDADHIVDAVFWTGLNGKLVIHHNTETGGWSRTRLLEEAEGWRRNLG